MAIEGRIRDRGGKLYVEYATTLDSKPVRRTMWWRVLESWSNRYNANRPGNGDIAESSSSSGGAWTTSNRSGSSGRVSTGDGSNKAEIVEDSPVYPPKHGPMAKIDSDPANRRPGFGDRGDLRWNDGRWEKLTARGWEPAGEGKAPVAKAPRASRKKTPAQLDAEIASELDKGTP